jgi:hypothetical protein
VPVEFDKGLESFGKARKDFFAVILGRYDSSFEGFNRRILQKL